ncbi:chaperone NapD [Spongorhabdus nitratireducens]
MKNASKITTEDCQTCAVSGLIVCTKPENIERVTASLNLMDGVEVHQASPEGKLVVTVEELPGQKMMVDRISDISAADGVLSAALVYAHQE